MRAIRRPEQLPVGVWRTAAPAVFAAAWGGNHYSPLLLLYREIDGYSAVQVNLFFAFYVIGLAPGFLLTGPLADRYGRRRLVGVAVALGIAGSAVLAAGSADVRWMCAGRLVCGVSVAIAMVAGTSWIKELSQHDADPSTRARRASLTLTAGFGAGAGVSGALGQWGPAPTVLPYVVQIVLSLVAVPPLLRTPETRAGGVPTGPLFAGVRVPARARRRFCLVVLPMAPWVFAAPSLAFVVAAALVADETGGQRIAFAALLAIITLGTGAAVQPRVPWLHRVTGGRHGAVGLAVGTVATLLVALDARLLSPWVAVLTAVLYGVSYGVCIVAGLVEVQAMARPEQLAGLTAVYWSLTYIGFGLPVLLSALAGDAGSSAYDGLLLWVAAAAAMCAVIVSRAPRQAAAT